MPASRSPRAPSVAPWERPCAAVGCDQRVTRTTAAGMFCAKHWTMVPSDVKTMVEKAFRPEHCNMNRWSARMERAMEWAQSEIFSVQMCGHRIPKATDFDFDD